MTLNPTDNWGRSDLGARLEWLVVKDRANRLAVLLTSTVATALLVSACSGAEDESGRDFVVDPAKGRFDPAGVYVIGHVGGSIAYRVVVSPDAPESLVAGIPASARHWVVRPTDGRLVYEKSGELAVFEPDPGPVTRIDKDFWNYPSFANRNDPELDDWGCTGQAKNVGPIWTDPDGNIAYRCTREEEQPTLYVADGETIELQNEGILIALGSEGRALTYVDRGGKRQLLIEDGDGEVPVRTEWPLRPYTARSDSEGFLAAMGPWNLDQNPRRIGDLVRVRYDGSSEHKARYGGWPSSYEFEFERKFALAADGTLYAVATRRKAKATDTKYGALLRFKTDGGRAEVLWDDQAAEPLKSLRLVSGAGDPPPPPPSPSPEEPSVPEDARPAKELIDVYIAYEQVFDPTVAELYTDDAVITNLRHYPTGQSRKMRLPAAEYKKLVRATMPLAAARNDTSTYSDFKYEVLDSGRVRITAQRYSTLKDYTTPITWLVVRGEADIWWIAEEHSESRP